MYNIFSLVLIFYTQHFNVFILLILYLHSSLIEAIFFFFQNNRSVVLESEEYIS